MEDWRQRNGEPWPIRQRRAICPGGHDRPRRSNHHTTPKAANHGQRLSPAGKRKKLKPVGLSHFPPPPLAKASNFSRCPSTANSKRETIRHHGSPRPRHSQWQPLCPEAGSADAPNAAAPPETGLPPGNRASFPRSAYKFERILGIAQHGAFHSSPGRQPQCRRKPHKLRQRRVHLPRLQAHDVAVRDCRQNAPRVTRLNPRERRAFADKGSPSALGPSVIGNPFSITGLAYRRGN